MRAVTLNPKTRGYAPPIALGSVMTGGAIGQVVASKNPAWKVGDRLNSPLGWTEYGIVDPREPMRVMKGVPSPLAMSVLGGTGLTAFFGVFEVLKPKAGQVAVVSGAAGATGMVAAQLLKIAGCKVIAIAGGPKKCEWVVKELGMDAAIDYKEGEEAVLKKLKELTPNFIDLYFDNTYVSKGGPWHADEELIGYFQRRTPSRRQYRSHCSRRPHRSVRSNFPVPSDGPPLPDQHPHARHATGFDDRFPRQRLRQALPGSPRKDERLDSRGKAERRADDR